MSTQAAINKYDKLNGWGDVALATSMYGIGDVLSQLTIEADTKIPFPANMKIPHDDLREDPDFEDTLIGRCYAYMAEVLLPIGCTEATVLYQRTVAQINKTPPPHELMMIPQFAEGIQVSIELFLHWNITVKNCINLFRI